MEEKKESTQLAEVKEENTELPVVTGEELMTSFSYDDSKSIDENASDLMELKASAEALKDEEFVDNVADIKKEQIKESAKANKDIHVAKKEAERVKAVTEIDIAFYEQWKSVLNFGGINEPTTKGFSIFMLLLVAPFYVIVTICIVMPITIIKHLFSAVNGLFEQIAKFGKIGRSIAFTTLVLAMIALLGWTVYSLLMRYGIVQPL